MKSINTLIDDIYNLFTPKTKVQFKQEDIADFGTRLATHVSNRIQEERTGFTLRLSNLGTECNRKLWLQKHRPDTAEPLSPQTRFKFLYGDILEELVLFLAKVAGHTVSSSQKEVQVNGVKGHIDSIIDGRLVDVKSASPFSFQKFKSHGLEADDPFAYRVQLGSYLHASQDNPDLKDKDVASFLAVDKVLGHMCLDTHAQTGINYDELVTEKRSVLDTPTPPERPYVAKPDGKSGNETLDTQCSYCDHKFECWKDVNDGTGLRTFLYSNGPKFLTKVERLPAVPEVNRSGDIVTPVNADDPF
jgi:hypothetical protein